MPTRFHLKISHFLMIVLSAVIVPSCRKTATATNEPNPVVLQPMMGEGTNVSIYTYTPYLECCPETTLLETLADTFNFNTDSVLMIGNYSFENSAAAAALLKFNNLPGPGKEIDSAILYLYGLDSAVFSNKQRPSRLPNTWFQYGNTAYPAPAKMDSITVQQVTGNWYADKVTWRTQPAVQTQGSFTVPPPKATWGYNVAINITGMVNTWINNPEQNFGCRLGYVKPGLPQLYPYPGGEQRIQFYSSYTANAALRPKLVISYK